MSAGDKDLANLLLHDSCSDSGPNSESLATFDIPEAFSTTPDGTAFPDVFNLDNLSESGDGGCAVPRKSSSLESAGSGAAAAHGGQMQMHSAVAAGGSGVAAARDDAQRPSSLAAAVSGAAASGDGQLDAQRPSSLAVGGDSADRKRLSLSMAGSGAAAARGFDFADRKRMAMSGAASDAAPARDGQLVAQKPSSLALAGVGGGERAGSTASAAGGAVGNSDGHSTSFRNFSDDDTGKDVVHTSDGNMSFSDGWCSVIGSNDGEGSETSESSYHPYPTSASSISDAVSDSSHSAPSESASVLSDDRSHGFIVSCQVEDDDVPCMDKPAGMMLARANLDDSQGDFVCSKIRQKYEKVDHRPCEVFEVVFKDGSKAEYSREEVMLYKETYDQNRGERGCVEFFFKV